VNFNVASLNWRLCSHVAAERRSKSIREVHNDCC